MRSHWCHWRNLPTKGIKVNGQINWHAHCLAMLISSICLLPIAHAGGVYKVINQNTGAVIFTDQLQTYVGDNTYRIESMIINQGVPSTSKTTETTSSSTSSSSNNSSNSSSSNRQNHSRNYQLNFASSEEQAYRRHQNVDINLNVSPASPENRLVITVDGKEHSVQPASTTNISASVNTADMTAGPHTLTAKLMSGSGQQVAQVQQTFHIIQQNIPIKRRRQIIRENAEKKAQFAALPPIKKLYYSMRQDNPYRPKKVK